MIWNIMLDIQPEVSNEMLVVQDAENKLWIGNCDQPGTMRVITSGILMNNGNYDQCFTHIKCSYFVRWLPLKVYYWW
jgi:hypothetical protein